MGNQKVVAELKITNKAFNIVHTVCEGNQPCTYLKLESIIKAIELNTFKHELFVTIDLRKWGYEHAYNLKALTERKGWQFNHSLDMNLEAQDKTKYQYNVYVKPSESGIVLTIPSRTIAIETTYKVPEELIGKYEVSCSAYLDKLKQPNKRSTIGFVGSLNRDASENAFKTEWTLNFKHPNTKELKVVSNSAFNAGAQTLSASFLFDVFKTTNQAIDVSLNYGNTDKSQRGFNLTSELKVASQGLGIDYVFAGSAGANWDRRQISATSLLSAPTKDARFSSYVSVTNKLAEIQLTAFNEELVHLKADLDLEKQAASVEASARILGVAPLVSTAAITTSGLKANLQRGDLVKVDAEISLGKQASLIVIGTGKELIKTKLSLSSQDFLGHEYVVNENDFKAFVVSILQIHSTIKYRKCVHALIFPDHH